MKMHQTFPRFQRSIHFASLGDTKPISKKCSSKSKYIFIEKSDENSKPAGVCKRIFAAFKVQPKYKASEAGSRKLPKRNYKNWYCFSNETRQPEATSSLLLHQTLRCLNWVMARDTDVVKDGKFSDFITRLHRALEELLLRDLRGRIVSMRRLWITLVFIFHHTTASSVGGAGKTDNQARVRIRNSFNESWKWN